MNLSLTQAVDQVINSRHSVRAYLDTPVSTDLIKEILHVASRAPSGTNTQPWKVYVVRGQTRQLLIERVCVAQNELFANPALSAQYQETFDY